MIWMAMNCKRNNKNHLTSPELYTEDLNTILLRSPQYLSTVGTEIQVSWSTFKR